MKKNIVFAVTFISLITFLHGSIPVNVMTLEKITPAETYYTGEIEAIEKGVFSFDIDGKLNDIRNVGEYVFEKIFNEEQNKIIRKGTLVASYDKTRQYFALKEAEMSKKIAEADLRKAKTNFARYKTLVAKKAVSSKDFLDITTNYMSAKLKVNKAENELSKVKYDLDACSIIAPFSGVVTKVFVPEGTHISKGDDVVELTKMTPLLVKIPFPEEIVSSFRDGAKVDIYPVNGGKPVSAWCRTGMTGNKLYAYIENTIIGQDLSSENSKYRKIYEIFPVKKLSSSSQIVNEIGNIETKFENNKNPLTVPLKSIKKDDKGTYVLKAEPAGKYKNLSLFKLTRVNIVQGGIQRDLNLGSNRDVKVNSLKDSGSLKLHDTVVLLGEKNIKSGDTVVLENLRWKFVPQQLVKVSIPSLNDPGIYVPPKAIVHQADNDNYVYLVEDGKAKITQVAITGRCSGFNRISGDGIVTGAKIIIFDNASDSDFLYNNADVDVKKTLPHSPRIKYKRADRLIIGLSEIEKSYY